MGWEGEKGDGRGEAETDSEGWDGDGPLHQDRGSKKEAGLWEKALSSVLDGECVSHRGTQCSRGMGQYLGQSPPRASSHSPEEHQGHVQWVLEHKGGQGVKRNTRANPGT